MMHQIFNKMVFLWENRLAKWGSAVYRWRYGFKGKNIYCGRRLKVTNPQCVEIGDDVTLMDDVDLNCNYSFAKPPRLFIGSHTWVGRNCTIGCDNEVIIGSHVVFGPFVHITDRNHSYEDIHLTLEQQPMLSKGAVSIGDETWIGFGAQIMSGVTVGKHCVIAAGAVVVKSVPDYCVVGGNPAKILKHYDFQKDCWVKD